MFGRTVFGDAASASDASVAKPVDESPSQIPINAYAKQIIGITDHRPNSLPVANFKKVPPPGSVIGVDPTKAINERIPQQVPINAVDPQSLVIPPQSPEEPGPGGPESVEQQQWNAWQDKYYPGIFHRPEMVGAGRYAPSHRFGPPTLGASPDGLGAITTAAPVYTKISNSVLLYKLQRYTGAGWIDMTSWLMGSRVCGLIAGMLGSQILLTLWVKKPGEADSQASIYPAPAITAAKLFAFC